MTSVPSEEDRRVADAVWAAWMDGHLLLGVSGGVLLDALRTQDDDWWAGVAVLAWVKRVRVDAVLGLVYELLLEDAASRFS